MESERAWSRWYLSLSLKQSMPGILGGFTINPLSKACCHRCPGGTKITVIISVQDSKEGRKWGGGGLERYSEEGAGAGKWEPRDFKGSHAGPQLGSLDLLAFVHSGDS